MKANKNKKKSIFRYLNFENLKTEINGYGYHYSFKSFLLQLVASFAIILVAAMICQLQLVPILCLLLVGILVTPYIILAQFRFLYEENRFTNSVSYMTQMIYSFKKTPKILNALIDTKAVITNKKCIETIDKAIQYIQAGKSENDLYKEALAIIEEEYGCDRMSTLHDYLMHVEKVGGEYRNGLNILLNNLQGWTERSYGYQKERKQMKFKAAIAIILCIVICSIFANLLPDQFSIVGYPVYQIASTVLLSVFVFIYAIIQSKLNGSWLTTSKTIDDAMLNRYKDCASGSLLKKTYMKELPVLFASVIGTGHFLFQKNYTMTFVFVLLGGILAYWPALQKKQAKNLIKKEVEKTFPDWIRNLSLNLQMQNVYVAIKETTPKTPYVLRTELEKLLTDINKDPVSIQPYNNFLAEYAVPEITTSMGMIYSLNKYGRADAERQINALIQRNDKMLEKAEILRNKDEIGITGFILMAVPELLTVVKMIIDMSLMLMTFLALTQTHM